MGTCDEKAVVGLKRACKAQQGGQLVSIRCASPMMM